MEPIKDIDKLNKIINRYKEKDYALYISILILLTYGLSYKDVAELTENDFDESGTLKSCKYNPLTLFKSECDEALCGYIGSRHRDSNVGPYLFSTNGKKCGNRANMQTKMKKISLETLGEEVTPGLIGLTYGYWYLKVYETLRGSSYEYLSYRTRNILETFHLTEEEYRDVCHEVRADVVDPDYQMYVEQLKRCLRKVKQDVSTGDKELAEKGRGFLDNISLLFKEYLTSEKTVNDSISKKSAEILIKDANGINTEKERGQLLNMIAFDINDRAKSSPVPLNELFAKADALLDKFGRKYNSLIKNGFLPEDKEEFFLVAFELGNLIIDIVKDSPEDEGWVKELVPLANIKDSKNPQITYKECGDRYYKYLQTAIEKRELSKCAVANALLLWYGNNVKFI